MPEENDARMSTYVGKELGGEIRASVPEREISKINKGLWRDYLTGDKLLGGPVITPDELKKVLDLQGMRPLPVISSAHNEHLMNYTGDVFILCLIRSSKSGNFEWTLARAPISPIVVARHINVDPTTGEAVREPGWELGASGPPMAMTREEFLEASKGRLAEAVEAARSKDNQDLQGVVAAIDGLRRRIIDLRHSAKTSPSDTIAIHAGSRADELERGLPSLVERLLNSVEGFRKKWRAEPPAEIMVVLNVEMDKPTTTTPKK